MKKALFLLLSIAALSLTLSCGKDAEKTASVYGIVSDASGNPCSALSVSLQERKKAGTDNYRTVLTTVTGSEGQYEFNDFPLSWNEDGSQYQYRLTVSYQYGVYSSPGYNEIEIVPKAGMRNRVDIRINASNVH